MFMSLPLSIDNRSHQSPQSNGLYRTSSYSTSKRHSPDDEQVAENKSHYDIKLGIKRRSIGSSPSSLSFKMQKQTTHETDVGMTGRLCSVCGDISTGIHFGGNSCESCKAFFRRSVQCLRFQNYKCSNEEQCPVNTSTRKVCQFCRYAKCTAIGMKPKWVLSDQEREEKYGSRRKRFRENRTSEEDPDIFKFLIKEEKLLIEDIAHALYQSRATYPLHFPSPSTLLGAFSSSSASSSDNTTAQSPNNEKPPSAPANLLIVPIQRLVLFARMLKDFDLFSEDDKVSLLKGSAIEIMVCSSNTLFNPKTHTFTNYLSRDQRAVVDDQVLPLDSLLIRVWGEETFNHTRSFLISMCNLHVDEVTSTLLVPVILFSPDRLNINDLTLVKRLQEKYVTLLRKYMNWRYGIEQTDSIYPKLLLQIVNLRSLSLAHGEIIQKFMTTSSVNPLVQEVTIKPEMLTKSYREKNDSLSSSPADIQITDFDKTPSNDTESNNGSDEDDFIRKKHRSSVDDSLDYENEDLDETNPRNIWRKKRKLSNNDQISSVIQTDIKNTEQTNSNKNQMKTTNDFTHDDKYLQTNRLPMKPHDHQVPAMMSVQHDDLMAMSNNQFSIPNQFQQSPLRKQSLAINPHPIPQYQPIYRVHSSSTNDLSSHDYRSHPNEIYNATMLPTGGQFYDEHTYEDYRHHYARISAANYQQQQNEQQLLLLSLANTQNQTQPIPSLPNHVANHQSQSSTCLPPRSTLDEDEQQLLNAIHAHPNKRDLVLNLLRQMNQSPSLTPSSIQQQQQQQQTNPYYKHHQ
ncbi:unnamed protein product [Rotaria magnacalcarata]|uniref:Uncharacterized protein n=2 Tax=Rotaria magnacalcarata TaxID=392030 RepID=A0A819TPL5_9BILA|nr:unnamed protein product [Rotaria magnacalcarata]CAF2138424.1 unnamed protein product [Rotaria magnacalcarata]CAF4057235.1 unnamed protein product [Rotaria magnacalcarata]CAF4081021.1 unnamed protein product [Rotaria magnacalcarata]